MNKNINENQVVNQEEENLVHKLPINPTTNQTVSKPKIFRWAIAITCLLVSIGILIFYFFGDKIMNKLFGGQKVINSTNTSKQIEKNNNQEYNNHDTKLPQELQDLMQNETADSLVELVTSLKTNGFKLWGSSTCRFTVLQRIMFGTETSEARKLIEQIYTECRPNAQTVCPGVEAFPTWFHEPTGTHIKGMLTPQQLREHLKNPPQKITKSPEIIDITPPDKQVVNQKENVKKDPEPVVVVENLKGITEQGPPLDAPVIMKNEKPWFGNETSQNRAHARVEQGDVPIINNNSDTMAEMAKNMEKILRQNLDMNNRGENNNESYYEGKITGEASISTNLDAFEKKDIQKTYKKP